MKKASISCWCLEVFLYLLITKPSQIQSANILAVLPSVWKSHYLFGHHLLSQLFELGNHTVTLISPFEISKAEKEATPNGIFEEIKVDGLLNNWIEMGLSFNIDDMHEKSTMEHFTRLMYATTSNTDAILRDNKVRELLQSSQKFDLLIVDLFLSDALLGLSFYYQIPTVVLSPSGSNTWLNQRFGNPQNAALDPSNFLPYTKNMTFLQRCVNTLMAMFEKLTYSFFHMISQQAVYTKHFEPLCQTANWCKQLPHHNELTENLSLALINTHPVLQYPRAFLPNMLSIAGAHLKRKKDLKLPSYIQDFVEGAPAGVIYMSFGANVYDFPSEKMELFLNVFDTLSEMRFIIKHDGQLSLPTTHNSSFQIMVNNWWPQQALLAHDKIKLFITSGGFMSITEALYFEKSILAMPITSEQYVLCEKMKNRNATYVLNYNDLSYDQIIYAIKRILSDKLNSKESIKELKSQLIQNVDGVNPLTKTLHAIEMTLHTKGLEYLRSHSYNLNFWNSILLDVMFTLLIGLLTILAIPFLLTCCILKRSYQNQTKLSLLDQQNHRYRCNEFPSTTNSHRICSKTKHRRGETNQNSTDTKFLSKRRRSSNPDVYQKVKGISSDGNSTFCDCSASSASAPITPISKRDSLLFNLIPED